MLARACCAYVHVDLRAFSRVLANQHAPQHPGRACVEKIDFPRLGSTRQSKARMSYAERFYRTAAPKARHRFTDEVRMVVRDRPRFLDPMKLGSCSHGTFLRLTRLLQPTTTGKVEKNRELDRAEAWEKEQAKREEREKNRLNKEDNSRLMLMKAAERQVQAEQSLKRPKTNACSLGRRSQSVSHVPHLRKWSNVLANPTHSKRSRPHRANQTRP